MFTRDAPIRIKTRDNQPTKTRIASFQGKHFVAEREDDELVIYLLSDEPLYGVTADHAPAKKIKSAADLNRAKRQAFK